MKVTNEKELGEALKNDEDYIEIEVKDLKDRVWRIKATGKVAWAVAFGAIGVAVVAVLSIPTTGGTSAVPALAANAILAPAAVSILGAGTVASAIAIAVAAGSVGALNKLRKYKMTKISDSHIILSKK